MLAYVTAADWLVAPLAVFVVIYIWAAFARTPKGGKS